MALTPEQKAAAVRAPITKGVKSRATERKAQIEEEKLIKTDESAELRRVKAAQDAEILLLKNLNVPKSIIDAETKANKTEYDNAKATLGAAGRQTMLTAGQPTFFSAPAAYSGDTAVAVQQALDRAAANYSALGIANTSASGRTSIGIGLDRLVQYDLGKASNQTTKTINMAKQFVGKSFTPAELQAQKVKLQPVKGVDGLFQYKTGSDGKYNYTFFRQDANGNYVGTGVNQTFTPQKDGGFFSSGIGKALAIAGTIALAITPGGQALAASVGGALSGGALSGAAAQALGQAAIRGVSTGVITGDVEKGLIAGALSGAGSALNLSGEMSNIFDATGLSDYKEALGVFVPGDVGAGAFDMAGAAGTGLLSQGATELAGAIASEAGNIAAEAGGEPILTAAAPVTTGTMTDVSAGLFSPENVAAATDAALTGAADTGALGTGLTAGAGGQTGLTVGTTADLASMGGAQGITADLAAGAGGLFSNADLAAAFPAGVGAAALGTGTVGAQGVTAAADMGGALSQTAVNNAVAEAASGANLTDIASKYGSSIARLLFGQDGKGGLFSNINIGNAVSGAIDYATLQKIAEEAQQTGETLQQAATRIGQEAQVEFQPYTLTTGFGTTQLTPTGATGTAADAYRTLQETALQRAQESLGAINPAGAAETLYGQLEALAAPTRERQQLALQNRLARQGLLGFGTTLPTTGGGMRTVSPLMESLLSAQETARAQQALTAQQFGTSEALRQQQLGTGLLGQAQAIDRATLEQIGTARGLSQDQINLAIKNAEAQRLSSLEGLRQRGELERLASAARAQGILGVGSAAKGMFGLPTQSGASSAGLLGTGIKTIGDLYNALSNSGMSPTEVTDFLSSIESGLDLSGESQATQNLINDLQQYGIF